MLIRVQTKSKNSHCSLGYHMYGSNIGTLNVLYKYSMAQGTSQKFCCGD